MPSDATPLIPESPFDEADPDYENIENFEQKEPPAPPVRPPILPPRTHKQRTGSVNEERTLPEVMIKRMNSEPNFNFTYNEQSQDFQSPPLYSQKNMKQMPARRPPPPPPDEPVEDKQVTAPPLPPRHPLRTPPTTPVAAPPAPPPLPPRSSQVIDPEIAAAAVNQQNGSEPPALPPKSKKT